MRLDFAKGTRIDFKKLKLKELVTDKAYITEFGERPIIPDVLPSKKIYVSPTGGGDGSSPDSPTTLVDALKNKLADFTVIYLVEDGDYHINDNIVIREKIVYIQRDTDRTTDNTTVKIIFDSRIFQDHNVSYSIRINEAFVRFCSLTLENAPKADTSLGWAIGGGDLVPISVGAGSYFQGIVTFDSCIINQTRDYFISTKHEFGCVHFVNTTINLSEDAKTLICIGLGTCAIGWYNSTVYYNGTPDISKLVDGIQGKNFLFYGTCTGRTWFENLNVDIIPTADNERNIGSSSYRFANIYGVNIYCDFINNSYPIPISLNKGFDTSSTVTETTATLKQEVTPDNSNGFLTYVEGIHIIANNPSGSGCTLTFEIRAYLDDGTESTLVTQDVAEGSSFDDWLRYIYDAIPNGRKIKSIRLYAYCSASPASGYEPTVQLERVTGIQQ